MTPHGQGQDVGDGAADARGGPYQGKKKQTEEKAKVVIAVWGMEFIQFNAALQI